jgi:DNA ligase-1
MKDFVELYDHISSTKSTKEKTQYITEYFQKVLPEDAVWALYFLSGHRIKRLIGPNQLFEWCIEKSGLPEWIVLESYSATGDLAETIALLINQENTHPTVELSLSQWLNNKILPLFNLTKDQQKEAILQYWQELDHASLFIFNKILTGSLRIGVSQLLTLKALSKVLNVPREILSQKLMGNWEATAEFFTSLGETGETSSQLYLNPYPFYLASPLQGPLEDLGEPNEWIAEWKWDGIRAQCINREGHVAIWSRGNELITHQFPEIVEAIKKVESGTVLDGEILAYKDNPLPFGELQKRLGRKSVSKAILEKVPLVFMVYDILEVKGQDVRDKPISERRAIFENWKIDPRILVSPVVSFHHWDEIEEKRNAALHNNTEGLILKRKNSKYGVGRRKGNWWKYKIDPKTIDAVLMYAQPGQGWRANLYTDYTFGVWHNDELVPIAKAYSGLSREEISQLDKWIRKNTVEKFGPVRRVKPEQVFEIAFEGIQESKRHKSGVAFRFPRILRWRVDKPPNECDTLEGVKNEFLK